MSAHMESFPGARPSQRHESSSDGAQDIDLIAPILAKLQEKMQGKELESDTSVEEDMSSDYQLTSEETKQLSDTLKELRSL